MYESYWGLHDTPFRNHADTRWFFESPGHAEALARLFFLTEEAHAGGLLTGAEGTGKTLLLRLLGHHVSRSRRGLARLDLDGLDAAAFAWNLAAELRLGLPADIEANRCWRAIDDALAGTGLARRHTVVLLDHPESAEPSCVVGIERLMAAARRSPGRLTIIAACRDASCEILRPLRRLAPLKVEIPPFDQEQTARYVTQTLHRAGSARAVFGNAALRTVFERTHGVPRLVNQLCELSLMAAMHDERPTVDPDVVQGAAGEMSLSA